MKTIAKLTFIISVYCLFGCGKSGGTNSTADQSAKIFAVSDCPVLKGSYQADNRSMTIEEKRSDNKYSVILGEGASEITVDGATHLIEQGPATYQASCQNGVLEIQLKSDATVAQLNYFFDPEGNLIERSSGVETYTLKWTRK